MILAVWWKPSGYDERGPSTATAPKMPCMRFSTSAVKARSPSASMPAASRSLTVQTSALRCSPVGLVEQRQQRERPGRVEDLPGDVVVRLRVGEHGDDRAVAVVPPGDRDAGFLAGRRVAALGGDHQRGLERGPVGQRGRDAELAALARDDLGARMPGDQRLVLAPPRTARGAARGWRTCARASLRAARAGSRSGRASSRRSPRSRRSGRRAARAARRGRCCRAGSSSRSRSPRRGRRSLRRSARPDRRGRPRGSTGPSSPPPAPASCRRGRRRGSGDRACRSSPAALEPAARCAQARYPSSKRCSLLLALAFAAPSRRSSPCRRRPTTSPPSWSPRARRCPASRSSWRCCSAPSRAGTATGRTPATPGSG